MGDTGGACRLDGFFHLAISCISKRKYYGEKRNTKIHLADCDIYHIKRKMKEKNTKYLLAGAGIHPHVIHKALLLQHN